MKTIKLFMCVAISICFANKSFSQTINWASINAKQKHFVNINAGWDYGLVAGVGYGYQLNTKMPVILHFNYSFPAGKNLLDDFKTKIGGTIRLAQIRNFQVSARVEGVFRRTENPTARLLNFGSEMSAVAGYYKTKWFVAGEFGFDKAIVTHFKHSDTYKEYFPDVKDGWYIPTGGNFFYGLQGGYSFKSQDIYLKIGKTVTQDLKTTALVPYYFQLGFNSRF